MGFIRGSLFIIIAVLFFVSVLVSSVFLTISLSLDYKILKPNLVSAVTEMAIERNLSEQINKKFDDMQKHCANNSNFVFSISEYVFDTEIHCKPLPLGSGQLQSNCQEFLSPKVPNKTQGLLDIPCETINQGTNEIFEYAVNDFSDKIYYDEYECGFWDCFKQGPFFLISKKAQDYWTNKFYFTLITSIILFLLMFILAWNFHKAFIVAGGLLIVSSFIFLKIESILGFFMDKIIVGMFSIFLIKSGLIFKCYLIIGIVLVMGGVLIMIFARDFTQKKFSKHKVK